MLLQFEDSTGYLRPGTHAVSWQEVVELCGFNEYRMELLVGLRSALLNLKAAGCRKLFLDGSFVSMKVEPKDYDGAWEKHGVNLNLVDPILLTFYNDRIDMKEKYKGELFLADDYAEGETYFRDFFRTDRIGIAKGVLHIDLRSVK